ncbi:hypothetical protein Emed_000476 [Eimeria media]
MEGDKVHVRLPFVLRHQTSGRCLSASLASEPLQGDFGRELTILAEDAVPPSLPLLCESFAAGKWTPGEPVKQQGSSSVWMWADAGFFAALEEYKQPTADKVLLLSLPHLGGEALVSPQFVEASHGPESTNSPYTANGGSCCLEVLAATTAADRLQQQQISSSVGSSQQQHQQQSTASMRLYKYHFACPLSLSAPFPTFPQMRPSKQRKSGGAVAAAALAAAAAAAVAAAAQARHLTNYHAHCATASAAADPSLLLQRGHQRISSSSSKCSSSSKSTGKKENA